MIDADHVRRHYATLSNDALSRITRDDLVPEARTLLEDELRARGLPTDPPAAPASSQPRGEGPYAPPKAVLDVPTPVPALAHSRLVEIFRTLVVGSVVLGQLLAWWILFPLPMFEELRWIKAQAGLGALAPALAYGLFLVLQPLWILAAIGLWRFARWGRPLFVFTYGLSGVAALLGGVGISLPWEAVLLMVVTLADGAVLALAFLPPLANRFEARPG